MGMAWGRIHGMAKGIKNQKKVWNKWGYLPIYPFNYLSICLSVYLSIYLSIYLPESERTNLCILLVITTAITITNRDRHHHHHHHHHHRHHHGQQQHQYINNNPISRYSHSYLIYAHN